MVFFEVTHDRTFLRGEVHRILGIFLYLPEHTKYVIIISNSGVVRSNRSVNSLVSPCKDPSKFGFKSCWGARGSTPPVVQQYVCVDVCSQQQINPTRSAKIWISKRQVWGVSPIWTVAHWLKWEITGYTGHYNCCDSILGFGWVYKEETSSVDTKLRGDLLDIPPIPDMVNPCDQRIRRSDWMIRSETNDMVDPEASKAQALIEVPTTHFFTMIHLVPLLSLVQLLHVLSTRCLSRYARSVL